MTGLGFWTILNQSYSTSNSSDRLLRVGSDDRAHDSATTMQILLKLLRWRAKSGCRGVDREVKSFFGRQY